MLLVMRAILALFCAAGLVPAHAGGDDARAWLQRMSHALTEQNYQGRFFHLSGTSSESMQIIHRVADGKVTERLLSLDGSGREIIRNDVEMVCYLPDARTVLVEPRSEMNSLIAAVPNYTAGLERLYTFQALKTAKVSGHRTQIIAVRPRDQYRYGYRLWLDHGTALPLKSQLLNHEGKVVEQILFSELQVSSAIPPDSLKPTVQVEGFRWLRAYAPTGKSLGKSPDMPPDGAVRWNVARVPAGFALTLRRVQLIAGSPQPVQHLVYSDGLASVSVFIELNPAAKLPDLQGPDRMGSASTYSTRVNGHQVTVVGEVPPKTVEEMAGFVRAEEVAFNSAAGAADTAVPVPVPSEAAGPDSSSPAPTP